MSGFTLADLERIVAERAAADPSVSYTAKLLAGGPARAAKKLGEEAVEAAIAAVERDRPSLVGEAADVIYHLLVVLRGAGANTAGLVLGQVRRLADAVRAARTQSAAA